MVNDEGKKYNIGKHIPTGEFKFDKEVSNLFDNMAVRSIPCYEAANRMLAQFIVSRIYNRKVHPCNVLDIGASSGNFLAEVLRTSLGEVTNPPAWLRLYAEDASPHMIDVLSNKLPWVYKYVKDVTHHSYSITKEHYTAIALLYVLQFLPFEHRLPLLSKVYQGLASGGVLVLGQKTITGNKEIDEQVKQVYHSWRMHNGYTVDEIYAKTVALQTAMTPNTYDQTLDMLEMAGFRLENIVELTRFIGFSTLVAIKD